MGTADALMTDAPGVPLLSLHADCQPIFFADPVRGVVAVAHAGWRGTVADIAGVTVRALVDAYGSDPADLMVALGPAIGGDRYEVGPDVITAWVAIAGADADRAMVVGADRAQFDLSAANRLLLGRVGVRPERVEASPVCTLKDGDRWFSHRGQGPATGRFAAIIALRGGPS
jgi:YfiH family protein